MKKKIILLLALSLIFIFPKNVSAITASMSCSSSGSVSLGNTITVTISGSASEKGYWEGIMSYDSSKLQLISGSERIFDETSAASKSYSYKFKAISTGTATVKMSSINVSSESGDSETSTSSSTCSINVTTPAPVTPKNSDNNLKSLSIEGATISPEFNKDTLEYSAEFPSDTTKITINAEKNDSKASISGTGEREVVEGTNKIEVVVTAENGSTKTYIINAIVAEKDPIEVKVNGKKYTVIRKKDVLEVPEGYTEITVNINGEEIPAYSNEVTGYLLVGLNDSKGIPSWYIYDKEKNTYTKYIELGGSSLRIALLKPNKKDIPYKYYESTFEFNEQMINGYTFNEETDFRLVYGINIETGEKSFYVYDLKEKTLQRFYNEQVLIYIELVKKCKYLLLGMGIGGILLFVLLISSLIRNTKFKKKYLSKIENVKKQKKEVPKEEVKYKNIEATRVMDKIDEKEIPKKKDKKKNKKREKTFLDE